MKNILIFLFLSLFLGYGCKYFKKSKPLEIDSVMADTTVSAMNDSAAYYSGDNTDASSAAKSSLAKSTAIEGRYYMIVGCFTVQGNADSYSNKLRSMGYEAQIIQGRDNFQMVAAKSYDNLRAGISEIDKFRNEVTPNAWVYKKR